MKGYILFGLMLLGIGGTVAFSGCAFLSFIFYAVTDRAFDFWTLWGWIASISVAGVSYGVALKEEERLEAEWQKRNKEFNRQFYDSNLRPYYTSEMKELYRHFLECIYLPNSIVTLQEQWDLYLRKIDPKTIQK